MTTPIAIVWPEGKPNEAKFAMNWLHMHWLMFIKGITKEPPFGQRVCRARYINSSFFDLGKTATQIAETYERMRRREPSRST